MPTDLDILVDRYEHGKDYTLSRFTINNLPYGFGVEDEYRKIKVKHETRIPEGTYEMELVQSPHFSSTFMMNKDYEIKPLAELTTPQLRAEYNRPHLLIHVKNIPNFENILWHWGNTDDDTSGCYIVGSRTGDVNGQRGVLESKKKYREIYPIIARSIATGKRVRVTYQSSNFDATKMAA